MDPIPDQTPSTHRRKGSFHVPVGLLLAAAIAAAGCAGATTPSPAPTTSAAPSVSHAPTATASAPSPVPTPTVVAPPTVAPTASPTETAAAAFPVTLTDDEGTEVTIESEPERVIGLSPAITETLFALEAGDKAVGGTDFDDFPPEAAALPDVATFTGVIIEQVVDLDPDLVIAAGNAFTPAADIDRMRGLGYPVLVVYAETVDEVLTDIQLIGDAVGTPAEAAAIADRMQARIDEVSTAAAALEERPRVFYQLGSEPEIYGPAPGSFISDMIELAGGEPITTGDPAVFSIPVERIVAEDPEVIVVGDAAYGVCPEQVMGRRAWQGMTAVKEGAVRPIDDIVVTRPGPRLGEGLAALALAIHPGVTISSPPGPPPFCQD